MGLANFPEVEAPIIASQRIITPLTTFTLNITKKIRFMQAKKKMPHTATLSFKKC
jgi:hypothetical protein